MPPTYTNPVARRNFPDPFVLKFNGFYYAYATGDAGDGRAIAAMSSPDLVHWEWHGGLLDPLPDTDLCDYWAPEVIYHNGTFYLYYAVTPRGTIAHHLRVAIAEHPLGPFHDSGIDLTPNELFAIDPHPFRDDDGTWYLFYARDWLEGPRAGTGIVVDRMVDFTRLAGRPRRVLRPFAEWQLFEKQRAEKWGLDWYTVEAPFAVKRRHRYVCFYSGGRWEHPGYGVGFLQSPALVADGDLAAPDWEHHGDEQAASLLKAFGEWVLGPGHNSIAVAPNNVAEYLVYHGWDTRRQSRMPRLDRLEWNLTTPVTEGPTIEPQPVPPPPAICDRFDDRGVGLGGDWEQRSGSWTREGGYAIADPGDHLGVAIAALAPSSYLLCEVNFHFTVTPGRCGAALLADVGNQAIVWVDAEEHVLRIDVVREGHHPPPATVALPPGFRPEVWHRLVVRRNGPALAAELDRLGSSPAHDRAGDGERVPTATRLG